MANTAHLAMDIPPREISVNLETGYSSVLACEVGEVDEASCHELVVR